MDRIIKDRKTRKALYLVAVALLSLGTLYGLFTAETGAQIGQALALLLGVAPAALAAGNTPAREAEVGAQPARR
ncbi:hypothetical protein ACHABX_02625 [Nesterenkonia halotolerans]|uniref:phage holin n=1 Tax=Nesterenkonia halotolerans TaxID=225325 RepID=UPI003EE6164A